MKKRVWQRACLAAVVLAPISAQAGDIIRIGTGAASGGVANVSALTGDALGALSANPAYLSGLESGYQLNLTALYADSVFRTSLGERSEADGGPGLLPDFAVVWQDETPWTLAAGVITQSAMRARFDFEDPPGTLGVSYGRQRHEAEYVVVNAALAMAYQVNEQLSLGGQVGAAYNRNRLQAPYIFQSQPALQGLKVLVDLDTDDFATSATVGLDYQVQDNLRFSLSYSMENEFEADGDTDGDLSGLGLGIQRDFHYQTRVTTALPAWASMSLAWDYSSRLSLGLQFDWINWEDSFAELPLSFSAGSNEELNALLGSTGIEEVTPLDWEDEVVVHVGARYRFANDTLLRLGYENNEVQVPRQTMTPLTGAILEHAVSIGTMQDFGETAVDYYYRFSFSEGDRRVDDSALQGGEYDGTQLDLQLHTLGISYKF